MGASLLALAKSIYYMLYMLVGFRNDVTKRQTRPAVLTAFEAVLAIKKCFSR